MGTSDHENVSRLVKSAQKGNRGAFSKLVHLMMNDVMALTYRMTADTEAAKDLAQDSFIAAWESLGNFRGEAKFESWLYRIATNKTLNYLNRWSTARATHLEEDYLDDVQHAPVGNTPEVELSRKQLQASILDFMQQLPPQQRLVFDLRFYEQLGFEEIASITGRAVGTVKTHYRQAVEKLRRVAREKGWHQ